MRFLRLLLTVNSDIFFISSKFYSSFSFKEDTFWGIDPTPERTTFIKSKWVSPSFSYLESVYFIRLLILNFVWNVWFLRKYDWCWCYALLKFFFFWLIQNYVLINKINIFITVTIKSSSIIEYFRISPVRFCILEY